MPAPSRGICPASFRVSPTIVVKNQPGAGSSRAASYIYSVAPKDGTAIGAVFPGVIIAPLLEERAQALFDPAKFQFLGQRRQRDPRLRRRTSAPASRRSRTR